MFVGWPFDVLDSRATAARNRPTMFEPWVPVPAQLEILDQIEGDYEAEDFGDDDNGEEGPYDDAASSADTSVGRPAQVPTMRQDGRPIAGQVPLPPARWPAGVIPPPADYDPWQGHW